jgi:hypothetical protein
MKGSVRLIVLIALAALFAFALFLPDISPPPGGQALAQAVPTPDFTLGTTKAEVTYETANECISGPISCVNSFWDSDSYQVNAAVDASAPVDLDTDVTQNGLSLLFFDGTCADIVGFGGNPQDALGSLHLISLQVIPGNAIHATSNKEWTIYSFEGNVPNGSSGGFDHLEMNLKINKKYPSKSSLHVEANTNFCDLYEENPVPFAGPVAMVFDIGDILGEVTSDPTEDTDFACVVVTPKYSTLDISSAYCPLYPTNP